MTQKTDVTINAFERKVLRPKSEPGQEGSSSTITHNKESCNEYKAVPASKFINENIVLADHVLRINDSRNPKKV